MKFALKPGRSLTKQSLSEKHFLSNNGVIYFPHDGDLKDTIIQFIRGDGGCLLLCGHLGVGKTSFINRVLFELNENKDCIYIPIRLNLANPVTPKQLYFRIIHALYRELNGPENLRNKIKNMNRLTKTTKTTSAETREESQGRETGLEASLASMLVPNLITRRERKWIQGIVQESGEYLEDETVEDIQDVLNRTSELLDHRSLIHRWWDITKICFHRSRKALIHIFIDEKRKLKVVFILDEMDKFAAKDSERLDELIQSIKSLNCNTPASFVLISSHQTLQHLENKILEGIDSEILGHVIHLHIYLPCLWGNIDKLCDEIFDLTSNSTEEVAWFNEKFRKYLLFTSRGNFRLLIRALSEYCRNNSLDISETEQRRVEHFAEIECKIEERLFPPDDWFDPLEADQYLLNMYHFFDYIFSQQRGEIFKKGNGKLIHNNRQLKNDVSLEAPDNLVRDIVTILLEEGYLEAIEEVSINVNASNETSGAVKKTEVIKEPIVKSDQVTVLDDTDLFQTLEIEKRKITQYQVTEKVNLLRKRREQKKKTPTLTEESWTLTVEALIGTVCPVCMEKFLPNNEIVVCPKCKTPHHSYCWEYQGGCAVLGCNYEDLSLPDKTDKKSISENS